MLARALAGSVSASTRSKGHAYFAAGAVLWIEGDDSTAYGVVRGTSDYRVRISRSGSRFSAACECPFFRDRAYGCKHIWAALLAADRERLLAGDTVPSGAWLDLDFDPADTLDFPRVPEETGRKPGSSTPAGQARRAGPLWKRFLADVRHHIDAADRAAPQPRFTSRQILYVIDVPATIAGGCILLRLHGRQRRKNGEWSKPKPVTIASHELEQLPDESDRDILSLIVGAGDEFDAQGVYYSPTDPGRTSFRIVGPTARRVLPLVAETGRAHTFNAPDVPLEPIVWDNGAPWRFELQIAPSRQDGATRIDGVLARGDEQMPVREPIFALQDGFLLARGRLARLDHAGTFQWLAQLRRSGAITMPAEATGALIETLATSGVDPARLPAELRYDVVAAAPRPSVHVMRPAAAPHGYYPRENLHARVQFDYEGTIVDAGPSATEYDAERRRMVRRDRAAEQHAAGRLRQLGFHDLYDHAQAKQVLVVGVDQFPRAVRTLVQEGWRVEAEGRVFRAPRTFQMHVSSGVDWFELHGRVEFGDGMSVAVPELLKALERGDGTVTLDDGTRGLVPEEWLHRYAGVAKFGQAVEDHVRFKPSQAALLDALLATQPAVSVDQAFARARAALRTFEGIVPLDPPPTFTGALREYQREALGWFDFLRRFGFGGCLADDMGLGKTVMVLALLASRAAAPDRDRRPSLAIVPRSLVFNWIEEARRFAPSLRILDYTGTARDAAQIAEHDLVLTTYGTLRRDIATIKDIAFDYVILDEAQAIKNAGTASAKAVRLLQPTHRLALSGTPIENHVGELWSLFEFLNPGLLGSSAAFAAATSGRSRVVDREDMALLARAVRPFILRRTKLQVAPELPERTEQTIHCELEGAQRKLYDELRDHYRQTLLARIARDGMNRSKIQVLEALLRLRQAACHPALVDDRRTTDPSAKLDVLLPQLVEVIEEGHKAIVFSQFTSFLAIVRERLDREGLSYEYLDGRTRDRAARVERFQSDPACPLFLISLKAGGLGLNLTAAEYVFLLDPWWNPAVEAQAIDRAHRIGQARHVFAYRLIAKDTVEEKVAELQQTKRELADAILSADAGLLRELDPQELEWLLS